MNTMTVILVSLYDEAMKLPQGWGSKFLMESNGLYWCSHLSHSRRADNEIEWELQFWKALSFE
jgi:hypothetical protein